jgi:hypothetical protein
VVFVDMQQEYLATLRLQAIVEIDRALDNCRKVLDHSRTIGLPVAFIRMLGESAFFNRATPFVHWTCGFEPCRNEMLFERASLSCYSCERFSALVSQSRGGMVLAGCVGESTLIDAFHRHHKVTYLCDASASHALEAMTADEVPPRRTLKFHRAGLYGEVYETADWIASTLPRKLGNGTNAGGSFRTTTAFGSCNPRGVPVRTRREPRPRHRAVGVGGHSRASDEAQPGGRLRIEGSMRCHGAG